MHNTMLYFSNICRHYNPPAILSARDEQLVHFKDLTSPRRSDSRLLEIPASCKRVPAYN